MISINRSVFVLTLLLVVFTVASTRAQTGMVTVKSEYPIKETTNRLAKTLTENELTIFRTIHHHQGAATVGMELPPTTVIIFGNPKLGTPLMQCARTVAIDLPQKMLVWENKNGDTLIGYNDPSYLKQRHQISGCDAELKKIRGALNKFANEAAGQ